MVELRDYPTQEIKLGIGVVYVVIDSNVVGKHDVDISIRIASAAQDPSVAHVSLLKNKV